MADVTLEGVEKRYPNGTLAVSELTLHVGEGELLAVLGPSGCGKTTTLRLIAGLEAPTRGLIGIGGRIVTAVPPHRRQVALVFQRPALYPFLTVRRNLGFGLELGQAGYWPWRRRGPERSEIEG